MEQFAHRTQLYELTGREMKTVTICGSMRFADDMMKIATRLEAERGFCVLQPVTEEIAYAKGRGKEMVFHEPI